MNAPTTFQRFPWPRYVVGLVGTVVFALSPAIPVTIAAVVAGTYGCRVDEGSIHTCMVGGTDWGGTLYTLGVMGWLFLATFPLAFLLAIVLLVVFVIHRNRWESAKGRAR